MNHSGVPPSDFEHHRALECAQPVVHQKKRNKDRRNPNWDEPFIANMTRRMKHQAFCRKLIIEVPDERFECRALEPQSE